MKTAIFNGQGEILRVIEAPLSQMSLQCGTDEAWIEVGPGINDVDHFIDDVDNPNTRQAVPKMAMNLQPTALSFSVSGSTTIQVPAGCLMTIEGETYEASGSVELSFSLPGKYTVILNVFPYRQETLVLEVV